MNEEDDTERSHDVGRSAYPLPSSVNRAEPTVPIESSLDDSLAGGWGDDPLAAPLAARTLSDSLAQGWGEDPLPDNSETEGGDANPHESGVTVRQENDRQTPSSGGQQQRPIRFLQALRRIAEEKRDVFFAFYFNLRQGRRQKPPANPNETVEITFGELWDAAGVVAYHLKHTWKIGMGQHAILAYGYGPSGLAAILGCWRAGVVAVPVDVPTPRDTNCLVRLNQIAHECHPIAIVLTDEETLRLRKKEMSSLFGTSKKLWLPSLVWRATQSASVKQYSTLQFLRTGGSARPKLAYDRPNISAQGLAMIQYTAGSTGDPKPVMTSFASLQASLDMTERFFRLAFTDTDNGTPQMAKISGMSYFSITGGWGLIHATLLPMICGWRMYYMSTHEFSQRPLAWLERISQHKVAWSLARDPDYIKVAEAFSAAKKASNGLCPIAHLDLSCVQHWHALGQPLMAETYSLVTKVLEEYGLHKSWYVASYGLTELVAGALFLPDEFVACQHGASGGYERVAVACRKTLDSKMMVKVVNPKTCTEMEDGNVGELWLSSPSVASGYGCMLESTQEWFDNTISSGSAAERFFRTGDAAFFKDDYLYIDGCLQDAIKVSEEVTLYPQDLEWTAEKTSTDVVPGCVAAIQSPQDDGLVIVYELMVNHYHEPPFLASQISKSLSKRFGVTPRRVVAIREGGIPRTLAGKIRRHTTAKRLEEESLDILYDSVDLTSGNLLAVDSNEYLSRAQEVDKVLMQYFGEAYDENATWDELGITSLSSIDLRYDLAWTSNVNLLSNSLELHRTPLELKEFVIQSHGRALPIKEPYIPLATSNKLSWLVMGILQAFGAVVILILFSASAVPAWYLFQYLVMINLELALVPIFMGTYTITVLLAKWIVIGRYTACKITVPSALYFRWWFVDRLVDIWEFWVGRFVVSTPALNLFYILLGANVSIFATLDGFCREFDLITVGPDAYLQHRSLRARRFASWSRSESGPKLTLRPIVIGSQSVVRGMLSPGVTIGKASVVEKLAVLPEGTQVGDRITVGGNPAVIVDKAPIMVHHSAVVIGLLKLKWLALEFWTFAILVLTSQWVAEVSLPRNYFEMWMVWWAVFVAVFSSLSVLSSIIVKWLLLGRRKPGKVSAALFSEFCGWAADYHFFLSTLFFQTFSLHSRFINMLLMAHGMDIDMASKVYFDSFPPSKMDLIHIRRSFVAGVSFDVKKYGAFYPTYVHEASIGENAHVHAGLKIQNAVIPPLSVVTSRIEREIAPHDYTPPEFSCLAELFVTFVYASVILCFKLSVYASYRYWKYFDHHVPGWCSMFYMAGAIGIQTTLWMIIILILQVVTYIGVSENQPIPWSSSLYAVYLSSSESFQTWSAVTILWGTQHFNDIARLFGSSIEGRTLYFGNRMYDGPFLTVSNRTICDGSQLCGHSIVYEKVFLGPTRVAGIVQEGTLVISNANITAKESGPWRPIVGRDDKTSSHNHHHMSSSKNLEAADIVMV